MCARPCATRRTATGPGSRPHPIRSGPAAATLAAVGVTHHGRTYRLDLADPTLREWTCTVLAADPHDGIVLDRSAFYPGRGGQPPDHGLLLWQGVQTRIVGTRKADDLYLIPAEGDPVPQVGTQVVGALEDSRRS